MEEFGVTDTQESTYTVWYDNVITTGLTGDLIWFVTCPMTPLAIDVEPLPRQAGDNLAYGPTPNDGYAVSISPPLVAYGRTDDPQIYPDTDVYELETAHFAAIKARG